MKKYSKTPDVIILSATVSSLPATISSNIVDSDWVVIKSEFSNPSAQTSDWTVTTADADPAITISGTISGTTTVKLYFVKSVIQRATSILPV